MATSTVSAGERRSLSTIGLKTVMAVSGLVFVGFVIAHMYGNLMIFAGADAFDEYAHHLRTFGEPMLPYGAFLWVLRIALIVSLVAHVWAALRLWARAGRARTTRYAVRRRRWAKVVTASMRWGGVALLIFVVFHILHFTTNTIQVNGDYASPAARLVSSFSVGWAVAVYTLAVLALGMHLLHGVWSAGMTLGLNSSLAAAERLRVVSIGVAAVVVVGFLIPPLSIYFGLIP